MKAFLVALMAVLASTDALRSQDAVNTASRAVNSPPLESDFSSEWHGNGQGDVRPVEPPPEDFGVAADGGPSLFAGNADEDPGILEIKRIARDLESRRALMIQLAGLQRDLIDFAMADPAAAWRSRIPSPVCEHALRMRICDAMTSSFRKEGGNLR